MFGQTLFENARQGEVLKHKARFSLNVVFLVSELNQCCKVLYSCAFDSQDEMPSQGEV